MLWYANDEKKYLSEMTVRPSARWDLIPYSGLFRWLSLTAAKSYATVDCGTLTSPESTRLMNLPVS